MIYLDYAATTPVDTRVTRAFVRACNRYPGNPNSGHRLGCEAAEAISRSLTHVRRLLNLPATYELIPTSGASESNNLAWKGVAFAHLDKPGHIITTAFEHSSITANANYLARLGFNIDIVGTDAHGRVDVAELCSLLRPDTLLVSICSINSEIGIRQPLEEIKIALKGHRRALLHVDATQSIGKDAIDLTGIDLISLTAHKFFGLKGIGLLVKKKTIDLVPMVHGGHSTTKDRRGTPATELILSLEVALKLALKHRQASYDHVVMLNAFARERLRSLKGIVFNSRDDDLPHVLNISLRGCRSRMVVTALSDKGICISNHTACESENDLSHGVLALTGDEELANSSIRLSFAGMTTKDEVEAVIAALGDCSR